MYTVKGSRLRILGNPDRRLRGVVAYQVRIFSCTMMVETIRNHYDARARNKIMIQRHRVIIAATSLDTGTEIIETSQCD